MTNDEIKAFLELAEKATPAPWINDGYRFHADGKMLFEYKHSDATGEDARFIAQSRTLAPQLAREVLRLREAMIRLRAATSDVDWKTEKAIQEIFADVTEVSK